MKKRLLAVLCIMCVAALMFQPAQGFHVHAEEVTTPTDQDSPCDICGEDFDKNATWVEDVYSQHVLQCPHGEKLESSRHNETVAVEYVSETEHALICPTCGLVDRTEGHSASCEGNSTTCTVCGATDIVAATISHVGDRVKAYDEDYHWEACSVCGGMFSWPFKSQHGANCDEPDVCADCGAEGVNIAYMNHDPNDHCEYDAISHWSVCSICGEKQYDDKHYVNCRDLTTCTQCGAKNIQFTANHVEHQFPDEPVFAFDEKYHWMECPDCGEVLDEMKGGHYIPQGSTKCVYCGYASATEITVHNYDWDNCYTDADAHWWVCTDCGDKYVEAHYTYCDSDSGVCASCGEPLNENSVIKHWSDEPDHYYDGKSHCAICGECGEYTDFAPHEPSVLDPTKCRICGGDIVTPTATPAPTAEPTPAPTATAAPTAEPTAETTAAPTAAPTAEPTATPIPLPTVSPEPEATVTPEPVVTATPEPEATVTPEPEATVTPEPEVTAPPAPVVTAPPAPVVTEEPAHEHSFDVAFVSGGDGTHSKTCLVEGCGETITEDCTLVTTDLGLMTCTACAKCGYAVYSAKAGVGALNEGEEVPATIVRVESASIAPADDAQTEVVPTDTVLVVHETTFEVPVTLPEEIKGTVEKVFTATLIKEGEVIQPAGQVKLSIPVDEETLAAIEGKVLMLLREDGTLVEVPFEIIDGEIVFLTDELGVFLLMEPEETEA